ncbi:MAG: antitoxin family protein [Armatimonadetes bacterium]|nr:antitoxin family protein [Armatimonadota bacterium]
MPRTIKAKYRRGVGMFEPAEPVVLAEDEEVTVTIPEPITAEDEVVSRSAAGGWAGIVDVDAFLKDRERAKRIRKPRLRL